jgi:hypothetical protein
MGIAPPSRGHALITTALVMLSVFATLGAATARADTAVLPPDAALPWAAPNHDSPLEQLVNPAATQAIGQSAALHCTGDYEWGQLLAQKHLPSTLWGYVETYGGSPLGFAEISPQACSALQAFAQASSKPTKCAPPTIVFVDHAVTTYRTVVVRSTKNGRRTTKKVRRAIHAVETVAQQTLGPPVPCFTTNGGTAMSMPQSYWKDYYNYAAALATIAHEPFHLTGDNDESRVNCHGMQRVSMMAQALGDTPDDAEQIARYVELYVIPNQSSQYWLSADCRDGGALDLNPSSSLWP